MHICGSEAWVFICGDLAQDDEGQPTDWASVDPELLYGPDGWCEAAQPTRSYAPPPPRTSFGQATAVPLAQGVLCCSRGG